MEYVFYSTIVVCVSILIYRLIEWKFPKPVEPDSQELLEANAKIESLQYERDYLRRYSEASDKELRDLQKVFTTFFNKHEVKNG